MFMIRESSTATEVVATTFADMSATTDDRKTGFGFHGAAIVLHATRSV